MMFGTWSCLNLMYLVAFGGEEWKCEPSIVLINLLHDMVASPVGAFSHVPWENPQDCFLGLQNQMVANYEVLN
jgi:hypothetical protein